VTLAPEVLEILEEFPRDWFQEESWLRGDLSYLVKRDGQQRAYEFVRNWEEENPGDPGPIFLDCHRGFGKSALELILAWERCLRTPGYTARYGAPSVTDGRDVITEIFNGFLMAACPSYLRPQKSGDVWTFYNPRWGDVEARSRLVLVGCKEHADSQRNKRSNSIFLDELRNIARPKYVIEDVFSPHFITKEAPLMVIASTPPRTTGHFIFKELIPKCQRRGSYLRIRGSENSDFTARDQRVMVTMVGAIGSPSYRREIECEAIADLSVLAVPEFSEKKEEILFESYREPSYWWPCVGADWGFKDYNAILFGGLDWHLGALIIRDEIVVNAITTNEIARRIREKEHELYCYAKLKHQIRRFADNDLQILHDLAKDHGLRFAPAEKVAKKGDEWACLVALRDAFLRGQIRIARKCENLIYQLENTQYNEKRTDFVRPDYADDQDPDSPIQGHADALKALEYLWRSVKSMARVRPFPALELPKGHWVNPFAEKPPELTGPGCSRTAATQVTSHADHITGRKLAPPRRWK